MRQSLSWWKVKKLWKYWKKARKWEFLKRNQWEVYAQEMRQAEGGLFLQHDSFSVVCPKPAPLRRWWIQQCVSGGCSIAFVSRKNLTFGFWRALFEKGTKKLTVPSSPVRQWGKDCEGKGEKLSQQPGFKTERTRTYSLFMSPSSPQHSCELSFDYFSFMATVKILKARLNTRY